jgi:hypothetical protein
MTELTLTVIVASALLNISTLDRIDDRPLVAVSFKCPVEAVGIQLPPTIIMHKIVDTGLAHINDSGLLRWEIVQMCK